MSENRTEQPTPKKIKEAREKGNVPQSSSLTSAVMFLAFLLILSSSGPAVGRLWLEIGQKWWSAPASVTNLDSFTLLWRDLSKSFLGIFVIMALTAAVLPVLCGLVQRGWLFLPGRLIPDFSRVFSGERIGKIFSGETVWRLADALVKTVLCAGALWLFLRGTAREALFPESVEGMPALLWDQWMTLARRIGTGLLIFSGADLFYRRWRWNRDLMMTPEEVRREQEESEGKPEVKAVRNDLLRSLRRRDR